MATAVWKNVGAMRGGAILLVVFNHAIMCFRNTRTATLATHPYSPFEAALILLGVTIPVASMAAFMIASGYFMARFYDAWPAAKAGARVFSIRYLLWSLGGYVLMAVSGHTLRDFAVAFGTDFGPFPAYWFLATTLLVMVLCPWLSQWTREKPWHVAGAFVAMEVVRAVFNYTHIFPPFRFLPIETAYFLLGILLSRHTDAIMDTVVKHRRLLAWISVVGLLVSLLESGYWWHVTGGPTYRVFGPSRLSVRIWSIALVAWLLSAPPSRAKWSTTLNDVGTKSLAILFLFDLFQLAMLSVGWHISGLTSGWNRDLATPPEWITHPLFIVVLFAVGLAGPLVSFWASERIFGKGVRRTLFG